MKQSKFLPLISLLSLCLLLVGLLTFTGVLQAAEKTAPKDRATKLYKEGNYQESLNESKRILLELPAAESSTKKLIQHFNLACDSMSRLNQFGQLDDFFAKVSAKHSENPQLLAALAARWQNSPHHGYQIAGEFIRGHHRGGGKYMSSAARDRACALQTYWQAIELLKSQSKTEKSTELSQLLLRMADAVMADRGHNQAWKLQSLSDLTELPDYETGWHHRGGQSRGAPVDAEGNPVFYSVPDSWEAAQNDGERWRWLLEEAVRWNPALRNRARQKRAQFLQTQFGVQTLGPIGRHFGGWHFGGRASNQQGEEKTGTYALHTLGENETIVRLATGIKRIELPDDQNHIKLLQLIIETSQESDASSQLTNVIFSLGSLFENRRQYPRAAEYWQLAIEKNRRVPRAKERLAQITKNWCRFESTLAHPAGQGATVDFRFRNGKRVQFIAHQIKVPQLLADVKTYLAEHPSKLDWQRLQIGNLGYQLVTKGNKKYLGEEVARWSLDLQPRPKHFDERITVTTPLQKAGAYLLTAKMEDGNSNSIVIWLNDTALIKKPLDGKSLYYVADAVTGQPIEKANVEFFGYRQKHLGKNKYRVDTKKFAEFTDADGLITLAIDDETNDYQWLATATTPGGRFAYLGFEGIWRQNYHRQDYQQVKVFTITDRPVYRPEQKVKFKFWVRHAQYDLKDESQYASQSFKIEIRDPKNEKVHSTQLTADAYGGLEGEWEIPEGATLGQYHLQVVNHGGGNFRVEEYKKPEFEVSIDAPSKPVQLGETITAKVTAKYYFGSPVAEGTVKYKVLRTSYNQGWYPPMPWDWLYGPGYGWFSQDSSWYPGWARWGCRGPSPWWFWQAPVQPEVIAEREVEIGPDGTIEIVIDTSVAKELHPDQDHSYQIQAEVVDKSRRTIVGNGRVLVAREPFKVYLWADRGYYHVGDTITVGTSARTLDGKTVSGEGVLRLMKIQYKDNQPVETEVGRWTMPNAPINPDTAADSIGEARPTELQIKASEPGQYRLAYELTDAAGHKIEGGQLLTVTGAGFDGSEFQFNDLEIIPDRREYATGDKVALQINTNRTGAAVLLFLRPSNGIYLPPQLVRLDGKSKVIEFEVSNKDMPNFFVEAVTVHSGKSHTVVKELYVPPAKRVLNVEIIPTAEEFLPGEKAKLTVKLTDEQGEPFVGSLALSIYDKAVEYIAGGSNVANIREFYWKWRRSHRSQDTNNLSQNESSVAENNKPSMQNVGVFGDQINLSLEKNKNLSGLGGRAAGGGLRGMAMSRGRRAAPMAAVAKSEMAFSDEMADDDGVAFAGAKQEESTPDSQLAEPTVRQNFADTALWIGSALTNTDGIAEVELDMPESLTTWKIRVWGMGHGTRVGEGSAEIVTRKNLIVRLQAPRFFVEKDEVVLSAIVHNYLSQAKRVRVQLALDGDTLTCPTELEQTVEIEAGGEQRVDWRVNVVREGTATIRMSALTDEESDAMQLDFPVHVHGMLKMDSYSGVLRPNQATGQFTINVPEQRRAEQTRLEIRYTPTLAGAMVDALPYLIDYPYGCTEQTLNRFVPAVITQQTLRKMGIDLAAIQEKRTNLNAQEISSEGEDDRERAKGWKRFKNNPVFDEAELNKIVKAGVNRLTEMQLSDGGWGWFSGWGEHSAPHTTAVVMHGLLIAQQNGVAIVPSTLERGTAWLENYQTEQVRLLDNWEKRNDDSKPRYKPFAGNLDALVYMVLAEAGKDNLKMRGYLFRDRTKLATYSLATFGLALHKHGDQEKLAMVMRNISQFVRQDDENQTAWLELPGGHWWHWYGSEYEAHAYYLKLLAATDPKGEIAPRLVKYLLNNRKHATYWNSTRDTALVVEAFADFLAASGEDDPEVTVEVWIDGKQHKQVTITAENLFTFDNKLVLTGDALSSGRHTVEIRRTGKSPIYYNGYLTNFTLEDDITAAGLEIKINRKYYLLTPAKKTADVVGGHGQVVNQKVEKYDRTELVNLSELTSGDLVEVELTIESKNDYEYILLEDLKAAGFEAVGLRSGYGGNEMGAYMEFRDDRVSLFVSRLARGKHSISYRLRAEIPGKFSALPARASAMYAPELKANSDEIKLRIKD